MTKPKSIHIEAVTPILRVANLAQSLDYYADCLGFECQWQVQDFAAVGRNKACIMLCQGDQGQPGTWLWIAANDVDLLHDEFLARGAVIRHPPTNYPWDSRELHVFDLDGHVLRFGSDLKAGEPMGPWLNGHGQLWSPDESGTWQKMN
ncbi:MAG: VOC family protein [Acidobacteria bacterium]|nr:VOC family protein [Acidobacteriota bacterium]MCB9397879.1 VOC family protein [Acidobacteriota bacterium]